MNKILTILFFAINLFAYDVSVSIIPQKFVVKQIGGDKVNVNVMVLPGESPATYSPKPKQLLNLKKSKLYFKIGVPFEKAWLNKFISINREIKIIDFTKYIKKGKNPHTWLSPRLLKKEALIVKESLIDIDPKNKTFYENNFNNFIKKISETDNKIKILLSNIKQRKFLIFHPSLYYFAKEYNLEEIPIEKEGKEASLKYVFKIIKIAKQNNIKIIFTSPEFSKKSAQLIANKIGGKVISFSPLKYDILKNILNVAKIINEYHRD